MSNFTSAENDNVKRQAGTYALAQPLAYVIDSDVEMRRSLHGLLSSIGVVSGSFECASDFIDNLRVLQPGPILLDIRIPDIDGTQMVNLLKAQGVGWPIIVMTAHAEVHVAVEAMRLGDIQFLEQPFNFEQLHVAMLVAFEKMADLNQAEDIRESASRCFDLLTPRQIEVIALLIKGLPNKIAAHGLSISPRTFEMHRQNALAKLQVKSIAQLILLASEAQWDFLAINKNNDSKISQLDNAII